MKPNKTTWKGKALAIFSERSTSSRRVVEFLATLGEEFKLSYAQIVKECNVSKGLSIGCLQELESYGLLSRTPGYNGERNTYKKL